jgi:TRAP-type C4-dicarboxylate transport system substrate-binding protein
MKKSNVSPFNLNKSVSILLALLVCFAFCFSQVEAKTVKLKLATSDGSKSTPVGQATAYWGKLIEEKSNGAIKVNTYFQGELGGQQEVFDQFVMGDIDLMISWPMTSYDKRISVLYTPYMVLSWEDALNAYKPGGWLNTIVDELFADMGLKYFAPWPEGFNGIATRGKHATTVEGAKGIKVRTPPVFPFAHVVQALGYQTADIAWNELYTAIQTGVVDGDAANIIFWDYEYFRDIVEYYVHTKQQFLIGNLVANLDRLNRLSKKHQQIISDAAMMVMEKQFKEGRDLDLSYRQKAIEAGIKYVPLSKEDHAAAIKVVREKVWPEMDKIVGKELMDKIREKASAL